MTEKHLLGSAPTLERLAGLISKYFYGSTIRLEGESVYNLKGKIDGYRVIKKGNRFRFEKCNCAECSGIPF